MIRTPADLYDQPNPYEATDFLDDAEADISERPCSTCGATETVEISDERQTIWVCAECGSDEP